MSKEIDNLLDNLIKEIDAQEGTSPKEDKTPKVPEPASEQAREKAEAIAKGVNKNYRRPPEPVKQSIPAPKITPVVEPDPVSHFSHRRPTDPAIRMHDRLDEDTLPAPDTERRPTQIRDIDNKQKKRKKRKNAQNRSIPAPRELPKRTIPHINVPDELPPDPDAMPAPMQPVETVDPEREALVRSRAEKIREQLKKRTLEETPIIPPPSAEEINDMLNDLEHPAQEEETALAEQEKQDDSIFEYLHQVLGVEEQEAAAETPAEEERPRWFDDAPAPAPYTPQEELPYDDDYDDYDDEEYDEVDEPAEEAPAPSRLRHLEDDEEEEEKPENPIVGFFKNLFGRNVEDDEEAEYEDEASEAADELEPEAYPDTEVPIPEDDSDLPPRDLPAEEPEMAEDTAAFDDVQDEYDFEEEVTPDETAEPAGDDEPKHGFFREAFDESAQEVADVKAEPVSHQTGTGVKQRFMSRNSYFIIGVIVFILALVGLITLFAGLIKGAGGFFSGGSIKKQLEETLYPLAVVDVPAFSEPAELTAEGVVSASIVDILMYDDLSGYTKTFDMVTIPADDILERGRELFGVDVQTSLETLTVAGTEFAYDDKTNSYNVPTTPMIYSYSPEVKSVKRTGDTYEVTVLFRSDVAGWQGNSRNFTEAPSKTMQATIEKKNTGFRVVRLVPAN